MSPAKSDPETPLRPAKAFVVMVRCHESGRRRCDHPRCPFYRLADDADTRAEADRIAANWYEFDPKVGPNPAAKPPGGA